MRSKTRRFIVVGGLVAQLTMLAALFFVSNALASTAERAHTDTLLQAAAAESSERIGAHFEPAEAAVAIAASLGTTETTDQQVLHHAGDVVLAAVAARMAGAVRGTETTLGRIGGEEFLLVFHSTSHDVALAACHRMLDRIRSTPIDTPSGALDVTASIGLATFAAASTWHQAMLRRTKRCSAPRRADATKSWRAPLAMTRAGSGPCIRTTHPR